MLLALTWGSLGRHYIAMFESTQNVMLKPTETWREALLDTCVMDLFFTVSIFLISLYVARTFFCPADCSLTVVSSCGSYYGLGGFQLDFIMRHVKRDIL